MRRVPLSRIVRWAAALVVLVAVAYLVVGNLVLATRAGRALLSTDGVSVEYRSARTWWPGRVHAADVVVEARSDAGEDRWRATVAHLEADVRLAPLLVGTLRARHVVAERVAFDAVAGGAMAAADLPDDAAAGATQPPPLRVTREVVPEASSAPSDDDAPHLAVDELELLGIERLSGDGWSYEGSARAHGTLAVSQRGDVTIVRARADVLSGELRLRATPLAQNLSGHLGIDHVTVRRDSPALQSVRDSFDGAVELASAVPPTDAGSLAPEGAGTLRVSVRVHDRALVPGSTADVRFPRLELQAGGADVAARGAIALVVREDGATLTGSLEDVAVTFGRDDVPDRVLRAPAVQLEGRAAVALVDDPFANAHVAIHAAQLRGHVAALPLVGRVVTTPDAEIASGAAKLLVEDGAISGELVARTSPLEATVRGVTLTGTLATDVELLSWIPASRRVKLRGHADLTGADGTRRATLLLEDGVVALGDGDGDGDDDRTLDGAIHLEMASALPFVQAVTGGAALPPLVAALASSQSLTADARLRATRDETTLSQIDASAGVLDVQGEVTSRPHASTATLLLSAGPLAVGVETSSGATSVILVDARRWFADASANRPGTTHTTGATIGGAP